MSKARLVGPLLMMVLGAALLVSPAYSSVDVGTQQSNPCYEGPSPVGAVRPCFQITSPETSSTTTVEKTTTTVDETTTTNRTETTMGETPTTELGQPTTSMVTTVPGQVGSGTGNRPAARPALARTGSNTTPMTVGGISLMVLGAGLLIVGRRRSELGA
ncbi:MAG: LPXTG cell wall anchor domain-containing protein [Aquihabitans sp.]